MVLEYFVDREVVGVVVGVVVMVEGVMLKLGELVVFVLSV